MSWDTSLVVPKAGNLEWLMVYTKAEPLDPKWVGKLAGRKAENLEILTAVLRGKQLEYYGAGV